MNRMLILGCGGHSKSVADAVEKQGEYQIAGFVDRNETQLTVNCGYKVLGTDAALENLFHSGITYAFLGMANIENNEVRRKLYFRLKKIGFILPTIIDPSAVLAKDAKIGEGTFVGKRAVINAGSRIGAMCILNTGSIVEHDCQIGDFTHVSVGSILCGNVEVGTDTFIGAGSVVIQNCLVGAHCVLGAGSLVLGDAKTGTKEYGIIKRK